MPKISNILSELIKIDSRLSRIESYIKSINESAPVAQPQEEQTLEPENIPCLKQQSYLNASELTYKYAHDKRFEKHHIHTGEIVTMLVGWGVLKRTTKNKKHFRVTELGKKCHWIHQTNSNAVFDEDACDEYICMMFNNPRLFSKYLNDLDSDNVQSTLAGGDD